MDPESKNQLLTRGNVKLLTESIGKKVAFFSDDFTYIHSQSSWHTIMVCNEMITYHREFKQLETVFRLNDEFWGPNWFLNEMQLKGEKKVDSAEGTYKL